MKTLNEFEDAIDQLLQDFLNCRAYFPYMDKSSEGETRLATAPIYQALGFNVQFEFGGPITPEMRERNNSVASWINQNFVIRLSAVLESHQVFSSETSIDQDIDGWRCVDLVRRLRHYFAHSSGRYNPGNRDHRTTLSELGKLLNIDVEGRTSWDLSINTVLMPLYEGCKQYATAHISKR